MVRCETIDVMVPADAEIVIEGEVPPNYMEDEGPFCEHAGMTHGTLQHPIINVKCITMRKNAIYYALQGGRPISESQPLDGFPMELVLYARIKDVGGFIDVKDVVALPYAGGSHIIVVQMTPRKMGEVRSTLMALLSSPYLHPKIGIAVDDDLRDVADLLEGVRHAVSGDRPERGPDVRELRRQLPRADAAH